MKSLTRYMAGGFALFLLSSGSYAESMVDGVYESAGDEKGGGKCTLSIASFDEPHKYGDTAFELESSGEGSCEWSAIGMSKSYSITAGLVTNSGTPAFLKVTFPYGPAGGKIEVTTFDLDGTVRNSLDFSKSEKQLSGG